MPVNNLFQIRRGTNTQWIDVDPVLASGEPGYDISNNIFKIGDGINNWSNLKSVLDITGDVAISGLLSSTSGNFGNLTVNSVDVSVSGHFHTSSEITNFNSSVSGLIPITNIIGGSNISVIPSGSEYTISVSGSLGLTTEEVDDRVADLLVPGSGININYSDESNTLTISSSGNITDDRLSDNARSTINIYLWSNFR